MNEITYNQLTTNREELQILQKDLLSLFEGLLNLDPDKRFSANEALMHPWLQKFTKCEETVHSHLPSKCRISESSIQYKRL
jgi:serine/threonine protein kinase